MRKLVSIAVVLCCFAGMSFTTPCNSSSSTYISFDQVIAGVPDTQNQSLGLQNFQTETSFNIWINPAQINEWQTVYGEVWGGAGNTWGGANFKLPASHLGVFVGRPYVGTIANSGALSLNGLINVNGLGSTGAAIGNTITDNLTPLGITNNTLDLFYGMPMDNMSLGLRLSMANNSLNQDYTYTAAVAPSFGDGTVGSKRLSSDTQIGVGALLKDMGPFEKLDVALTISIPSVNNSFSLSCVPAVTTNRMTASDELKSTNAANMSLLARGLLGVYDNKLYTTFGYASTDISAKRTALTDNDVTGVVGLNNHTQEAFTDKTTNLVLDAAYHTQPSKDIKAIYTFGFRSSAQSNEVLETDLGGQVLNTVLGPVAYLKQEITSTNIPFSVAVEHKTWTKVCTRIGVQSTLMSNTKVKATSQIYAVSGTPLLRDTAIQVANTENTTTPIAQAATVSLGFGIQPAKDFDLDIAIVSTIFDLDSGAGVSDLISRASIRYHF